MNLSVCATARTGLLIGLGCLALSSFAGTANAAKGADYLRAMRESGFTENRGQWDSRALYFLGGPGKNVWVTKSGFVIDVYHDQKAAGPASVTRKVERTGQVLRFELEGASSSASAFGSSQIPRRIDYLMGGKSSRVVSTSQYKEAYVTGVYNNVDLRTYTDGGQFRYDVIAKAGANPSQIRFKVSGADRITVDDKGSLLIQTCVGQIKQSQPVVYQQVGSVRSQIPAKFTVSGNKVGFSFGAYNPNLPLVIDPLVYGSYVGADQRGNYADDFVFSGAANSNGDLYMTGATNAYNFPVLDGPYGYTVQNWDAYLVRMAADAYALDYAAFIGGANTDEALSVGLAEAPGVLWLGGVTNSPDFPGSLNPSDFDTAVAGNANFSSFWFMKFSIDAKGDITPNFSRYDTELGTASYSQLRWDPYSWSRLYTNSQAYFGGMAVASNGAMYFAGDSPNVPASYIKFMSNATRGGRDGFVQRFEGNGVIGSSRVVCSPGTDYMGKIAATPDKGVMLVGTVLSNVSQDTSTASAPIFPTTSGVYANGRLLRNDDAFAVKMSPSLGVVYSTLVGGASRFDEGTAVAVDQSGSAYLLTIAGSFDYPRTRGVYDQLFSGVHDAVTKLSPDASSIVYSTGLRHSGDVQSASISVDNRGVAVIGGTVGFTYPGGTPPQAMVPGSIPVTDDAVDPDYTGGDDSVYPDNTVDPTNLTGYRATFEGFVQFLNPDGTNVLYASYLGGGGDDFVNQVFTDRVGATWILGYTENAINGNGVSKAPVGLQGYITPNAFKYEPDYGGESLDGFAVKMRIGLPTLTGVSVSQASVAGGLGASTTGAVTLAAAAPAGGVVINLSLSNPSITSFNSIGGQSRRSVVIPAGATTATFPIYTSPVVGATNSTLRATLDNDFLVTEITVNPWLSEMTTTPGVLVGGNQVNLIVRLFQDATQEIRIPVTTADASLIVPPTNNEIIVPAGSSTASVLLDTGGVEATTDVAVTGTLLGVVRSSTVSLTRAELASVSFNPNRILSGESSTMTISFTGKVGADRTIDLARTAGAAVAFTTPLTIMAQQSEVQSAVTAPTVASTQSATLAATCAGFTASQTLFIDPIDILNIQVNPGTSVLGGTLMTGTVNLTRPAGQNDILITLASSNDNAGSLNMTTVKVPAGSSQSEQFEFQTNIVGTDQTTQISASKTGFTTRSISVVVRAIPVAISIDPTTVLGGSENSTAVVSIGIPAPAGGINVGLSTTDATVATVTPNSVFIPEGSTQPAAGTVITVETNKVAVDRNINVVATVSPLSTASAALLVRAPRVVSLSLSPTQLSGGASSIGTVTLETEAPDSGMALTLASSDSTVSVPATVFIEGGSTTGTFQVTTIPVSTSRIATISATGSSSSASADLEVEAATVGKVTFSPSIVRGGESSVGTVTLATPAPPGGMVLLISSDSPAYASATVASVTIPEGKTTATFNIKTNRISRRINVGFTLTIQSTGTSGRGFLGVRP